MAITEAIQHVMGSNASPDVKKFLMQYIQESDNAKKQLQAENHNLKNSGNRSRMLFDHVVNTIVGQLGEKLEEMGSNSTTTGEPAKDNSDAYDRNIPKLLAASFRLHQIVSNLSQQAPSQKQQEPERQAQIGWDPELDAQFAMFREAMAGNVGMGSYGGGGGNNNMPRQLHASYNAHKRPRQQQQQQQGAGAWYESDDIHPSTRELFRETQSAANSGFGNTIRKTDIYVSGASQKSHIPDETNLTPFKP